jgi:hypothetical protein
MSSYAVDRKRWAALSIFEQMGNTYAEVGRTIQAKKSGDNSKFEAALTRALDLFEATTAAQIPSSPHRAKEILRAEDQFLSLFFGKEHEKADEQRLENYFMQYAIAARLNR